MRKLVYEISNGDIVTTYKLAQDAKEYGFTVKEILVDYIPTEIKKEIEKRKQNRREKYFNKK